MNSHPTGYDYIPDGDKEKTPNSGELIFAQTVSPNQKNLNYIENGARVAFLGRNGKKLSDSEISAELKSLGAITEGGGLSAYSGV